MKAHTIKNGKNIHTKLSAKTIVAINKLAKSTGLPKNAIIDRALLKGLGVK